MCDWLLSPGHTFATVLEATRGINHYLEWRTMNETEMDESLEDLDLEALYRQPVKVPAEAPKRKRRKYRRYPRPECTAAERQALMELRRSSRLRRRPEAMPAVASRARGTFASTVVEASS